MPETHLRHQPLEPEPSFDGAARSAEVVVDGDDGLAQSAELVQIGAAKYGVRNEDGTLNAAKLEAIAALPQVKMFEVRRGVRGERPH